VAEPKGTTTLDYMWYRSGAVAVLGWSLGCSDAGSTPPASMEVVEETPSVAMSEAKPGTVEGSGAGLQLSIDGWTGEILAKAQLDVVEGERGVRLEITGGGVRDILLLNVDFENLEGSMGRHQVAVGLPGEVGDSAIASIEGQWYHSQAGQIEVSLSADGSITGSFELALAENPEVQLGEPVVFELSEDLRGMKGQFGGEWKLFCLSHMPGHMTSLVKGGDYCDALEF